MNSRDIILANIEHNHPVRPGLNFSSAERKDWLFSVPEHNRHFTNRINDLLCLSLGPSYTWQPKRWTSAGREYYDDEWGNLWVRMQDGCLSGEVEIPALDTWDRLNDFKLPDYDDPRRYDAMRSAFAEHADQFKIAVMPGWMFSSCRYMRRMETYLCDLIEYPEQVHILHQKVRPAFERIILRFADTGADAIVFYEDMGTQQQLLMSPRLWREYFREHYVRLNDLAHENGLKVIMHSCGRNHELLDDLARAGIDCFQFDQPRVYDLDTLADTLRRHKAALWAPVDIQTVLPTGDRRLIEEEARRMVRTFQGFLIMKNYSDLPGVGIRPEWDQWAYDAVINAIGVQV